MALNLADYGEMISIWCIWREEVKNGREECPLMAVCEGG